MSHSEPILYSENPEKEPISFHGLEPFEIKNIDGEFVACLPVWGGVDKKDKPTKAKYGEIKFSSEKDAYEAVEEARKEFNRVALN